MEKETVTRQSLAASITKEASKQTYFTIRFFVDRDRVEDAYRAYGYFRWVDDILDADSGSQSEKIAFIHCQKALLDACYRGELPDDLCAEEWMLVDLVRNDREEDSGLQSYLRNMMEVMIFDAHRRGRTISQAELSEYSHALAVAVTEAMHYFIGHNNPTPRHEARYLAVIAAHITHMLRDAFEDMQSGYINVPGEYLRKQGISSGDMQSKAYREWVQSRVELARRYFEEGRKCMAQIKSLRCRLAGYAYTARFEWMLHRIEKDNYYLRHEYPERKSLRAGLWMGWTVLKSIIASAWNGVGFHSLSGQPIQMREL